MSCFSLLALQKKGDTPTFMSKLEPIEITEGDDFQLSCNVTGRPQPEVQWFRDEVLIKPSRRFKASYDGNVSALTVKEAELDDDGVYKCVVTNNFGSVSSKADVTVLKKHLRPERDYAPIFEEKQFLEPLEIQVRQPVEVSYHVRGRPKPTVTWWKNGKELRDGKHVEIRSGGTYHTLYILRSEEEDAGSYKCLARNDVGSAERLFEVQVEEPSVTWYRNKNEIVPDGRSRTTFDGETYKLILQDIKIKDAGQYECIASNPIGKAFCTAEMTVNKREAPVFVSKLRPLFVTEGDNVSWMCKVAGMPRPTVEWYRDNQPLRADTRWKMDFDGRVCSLFLSEADCKDKGVYNCVITNSAGSAFSSAELQVDKKANKPKVIEKMNDVQTVEGTEARFDVRFSGLPRPEVTWYRNSIKVRNESRFHLSEDGDRYSLTITDTKLVDTGTYKCVATNEGGKITSRGDLDVRERQFAPEFYGDDELKEPVVVQESDAINFKVRVRGKPVPTIVWYKDGEMVRDVRRFEIRSRGDIYTFATYSASAEDAGTYTCEASNKLGK
ncbi:predicted protein, partial [Nematostella vectensis]